MLRLIDRYATYRRRKRKKKKQKNVSFSFICIRIVVRRNLNEPNAFQITASIFISFKNNKYAVDGLRLQW